VLILHENKAQEQVYHVLDGEGLMEIDGQAARGAQALGDGRHEGLNNRARPRACTAYAALVRLMSWSDTSAAILGATMRRMISTLVALSLAAAVAAPITAEARSKKKKRAYVQPYATESYRAPRSDYQYEEFIAERRQTGSSSWWQQMDREGRGGQSRAN
jgi:hypothetical protein